MTIRRLTGPTLLATVGLALLGTLAIMLFCSLIGADMRGGGKLSFLSLGEVWAGLTGTETDASRIYVLARLPRILAAAIVGAGLAGAGCAFQAVLRNPLAEPYTLGVSSGASLGAVLAIRFGLDTSFLGGSALSVAALGGSGLTVYMVWRLGKVGNALPPATLLLAGVIVAMWCSAATMLAQYTASFVEVTKMVHWLMGGLDLTDYTELGRASAMIGIGMVVLLSRGRDLNALSAGSDAAASVGVNAARTITITFAMASLIVGAAISIAGPIGFIGLIVPHAMRAIVGADHRILLPVSMLAGAALLIVCDTVARVAMFPAEIPVGIVTALLGGPFFVYLLRREKTRGQLWGG